MDATSVNGFKNALDKEWEDVHGRQKLPSLTSPLSYKYKYKYKYVLCQLYLFSITVVFGANGGRSDFAGK